MKRSTRWVLIALAMTAIEVAKAFVEGRPLTMLIGPFLVGVLLSTAHEEWKDGQ